MTYDSHDHTHTLGDRCCLLCRETEVEEHRVTGVNCCCRHMHEHAKKTLRNRGDGSLATLLAGDHPVRSDLTGGPS